MEAKKTHVNKRLYPSIHAELPANPKRLYALPLIGFIVKSIFLIPTHIILFFFNLVVFFSTIINSFIVLFTGKYWNFAYRISVASMQYYTRINFFLFGITDTYPGFSLYKENPVKIEIHKPEKPNRLYSIPIIGIIIRIILLLPFLIYSHIISLATTAPVIGAILWVFFKGYYPESCFEFIKDSQRLTLATSSYILGLSDTYPTFKISMNHKGVKIFFVITGIVLFLLSNGGKNKSSNGRFQNYQRAYPTIKK